MLKVRVKTQEKKIILVCFSHTHAENQDSSQMFVLLKLTLTRKIIVFTSEAAI